MLPGAFKFILATIALVMAVSLIAINMADNSSEKVTNVNTTFTHEEAKQQIDRIFLGHPTEIMSQTQTPDYQNNPDQFSQATYWVQVTGNISGKHSDYKIQCSKYQEGVPSCRITNL